MTAWDRAKRRYWFAPHGLKRKRLRALQRATLRQLRRETRGK